MAMYGNLGLYRAMVIYAGLCRELCMVMFGYVGLCLAM